MTKHGPLLSILPPVLAADKGMADIAHAVDAGLASVAEEIRCTGVYSRLEELSVPALDLLAWQIGVDFWEPGLDRAIKVRFLREAIALHKMKGTPAGLKRGIYLATGLDAKIHEWFEYGGEPFWFKVQFEVHGADFSPANLRLIFAVVENWKNTRSWLECVATAITAPRAVVKTGLGCVSRTRHTSKLFVATPPKLRICAGTGAVTGTRTIVYGQDKARDLQDYLRRRK